MTDDHPDAPSVRAATERCRVPDPDDDDVAAAVDLLASMAARYADRPAPDVRELDVVPGDDEYNAFRSRFELREGDGPLDLDVAVKDNFGLAGAPMACGSRPLSEAVSTRDSTVVTRLLDAGATLVGKTHMDEFAYGATGETNAFGPARNPRAPEHVTGGSSSGSAAAVAAGLCDVAVGSDTGGSVRMPAAFCGIVGVKPTWGAVSRDGMVDLAASFDHPGVLAGDVATAGRALAAVADEGTLAGFDGGSRPDVGDAATVSPADGVTPTSLEDVTLGRLAEGFGDHVRDPVATRVDAALDALADAGAAVVDVSAPGFTEGATTWDVVTNVELVASLAAGGLSLGRRAADDPAWRETLAAALAEGTGFGPTLRRKTAAGAALLDAHPEWYAAAQNDRAAFAGRIDAALADVDALCLPTMARTAPEIGRGAYAEEVPLAVNTRPFNLTGTPAVSLPAGDVDGLPVGLLVVGPRGADAALLALAAGVEAVLPAT